MLFKMPDLQRRKIKFRAQRRSRPKKSASNGTTKINLSAVEAHIMLFKMPDLQRGKIKFHAQRRSRPPTALQKSICWVLNVKVLVTLLIKVLGFPRE
jgi:hypothetical protein